MQKEVYDLRKNFIMFLMIVVRLWDNCVELRSVYKYLILVLYLQMLIVEEGCEEVDVGEFCIKSFVMF